MESLFENDPAFAVQRKKINKYRLRDAQGRFATERESRASKALYENERLKRDVEKYRRMYMSAGDLASFWHRKYLALEERLKRDVEKYRRIYMSAGDLASYWHRKYLALEETTKSKQHDTRNKRSSQNA